MHKFIAKRTSRYNLATFLFSKRSEVVNSLTCADELNGPPMVFSFWRLAVRLWSTALFWVSFARYSFLFSPPHLASPKHHRLKAVTFYSHFSFLTNVIVGDLTLSQGKIFLASWLMDATARSASIEIGTFLSFALYKVERNDSVSSASPNKNKANYMATPVACGWAGAVIKVTRSFGQEQWGLNRKNPKKVKCDGRTNGPTNRLRDQRTNLVTKCQFY